MVRNLASIGVIKYVNSRVFILHDDNTQMVMKRQFKCINMGALYVIQGIVNTSLSGMTHFDKFVQSLYYVQFSGCCGTIFIFLSRTKLLVVVSGISYQSCFKLMLMSHLSLHSLRSSGKFLGPFYGSRLTWKEHLSLKNTASHCLRLLQTLSQVSWGAN